MVLEGRTRATIGAAHATRIDAMSVRAAGGAAERTLAPILSAQGACKPAAVSTMRPPHTLSRAAGRATSGRVFSVGRVEHAAPSGARSGGGAPSGLRRPRCTPTTGAPRRAQQGAERAGEAGACGRMSQQRSGPSRAQHQSAGRRRDSRPLVRLGVRAPRACQGPRRTLARRSRGVVRTRSREVGTKTGTRSVV